MRRRDRHFVFVLLGCVFCNLVTAVVGVVSTRVALRRAESAKASAEKCEKVSIEAASTVVSIADHLSGFSQVSSDSDDLAPASPVIVGYGQTKSRNAFYIYRDVSFDGVTRREYVQRIPFSSVGDFMSGANQKPF